MKRVDIKTGFICNNNCRFCVQADNKCTGNRTFEEIEKDLIECKERCDGVVFTGGEVTIREDFFKLVQTAQRIGYKEIQVQTNGRCLSSKRFCEDAIDAGVTEFAPAVHGYCANQHDFLTRSKGSFKQTVKGIMNVRNLGMKVITNTVVVKPNFRNCEAIARLLVKLGVYQYQLAFVHPMGNVMQNYDAIVPVMSIAAPYIHKGLQVGIDNNVKCMAEAMPYCMMKGYEDYVSEKIIPATEIRGKEHQNTSDFGQERKNLGKKKFRQCKKCVYDPVCEGPWKEYPEKRGEDEFKPVKKKTF